MAKKVSYSLRITVLLLIMSEHTMSFMIPTIMVYYLEKLLAISASEEAGLREISVKIGILEGFYGICAVFGGVLWGLISDQIGRKNSLIIILTGVFITSIGLGLAPNYGVALLSRILAGFFAGIIPMTKTLIRDLSDDSNISIFYSYFGGGYGAASIFGPLLGAVLSTHSRSYPGSEKIFLLDDYPYFLPLLAHALLVLTTLVMVISCVPDAEVRSRPKISWKLYSFLKNKDYLSSSLILFLSIFIQYCFRTIISLWLRLDQSRGGMGWKTPEQTGRMNAISGIISMVFPLVVTDYLKKKFGIRMTCILLSVLVILPNSLISYSNHYGNLGYPILVICNGFCIAFFTVYLSIISIAVSNCVETDAAGTAIGFSQAVVAFSRAAATSGTAFVFGFLQEGGFDLPTGEHFLFHLSDFYLVLIIILIKFVLDKRVEKREVLSVEESLLEKAEEMKKI